MQRLLQNTPSSTVFLFRLSNEASSGAATSYAISLLLYCNAQLLMVIQTK